ncbi:MAG: protein-disulfide reductase DsbD domain-containing protein [Pseudomonadota bacterium]
MVARLTGKGPTALLAGLLVACSLPAAARDVLHSPWAETMHARARLIAGRVEHQGRARSAAGVEIDIAGDWKTYWRTPGDAGGVPPVFDWSGSENLVRASVLFPAPKVMTDRAGNTIGYKGPVVLPVLIEATDASRPVKLALKLEYGVCRDICIPAEASLALALPPADEMPASDALDQALMRVPRPQAALRPGDPVLQRAVAELKGARPRLVVEARFPGASTAALVLAEAPDGLPIPLPRKTAERGDVLTFEADLSSGVDLADLAGQTLQLTLIGGEGQSEAEMKVD